MKYSVQKYSKIFIYHTHHEVTVQLTCLTGDNMSPPHGDPERNSNIRLYLWMMMMQKCNESWHCVSQVCYFVHFEHKNY